MQSLNYASFFKAMLFLSLPHGRRLRHHWFVLLRPLDMAFQVAPTVLWLSLLNAVACTVLPILLVMMAVVILDESLTAWVMVGTVLVISGVWLVAKFGQQKTLITKE